MEQLTKNQTSQELLDFINKSPCCFYAIQNVCKKLKGAGFVEITEKELWHLERGKSYFVCRNSSSIVAFTIPENAKCEQFKICASHSDSPSFKIKGEGELKEEKIYTKLNVEKYGGMLCAPWFDRPLSVAGRIICKADSSDFSKVHFVEKLVNVDRDLLLIPNLAIHLNHDANKAANYNVQNNMLPIFSCGQSGAGFWKTIASCAEVPLESIVGSDLFLYNRDCGTFWGEQNEFIASPRLDDLECVFTTLKGFLDSEKNAISVFCVFDNEEVGSETRQGAASTFLRDCLFRINFSLGGNDETYCTALANSFLVSADNAHAFHPNYASSSDPQNRPKINAGPVIKFNGAQKYTSDSYSSAVFREACSVAKVPFQIYTNRSDIAGGSTLGNISNTQVSIPAVDVGIAQWAMHSPLESAGSLDPEMMVKAIKAFYELQWDFKETNFSHSAKDL